MVSSIKTKIYFFSLILIALAVFLLFLSKSAQVQAVESIPDSLTSQGWFCAKTTYCSDKEGVSYQEGTCTVINSHRVKLEVDPAKQPLPNNDETYLVECISPVNNDTPDFKCTTGSSDLDLQAFGQDNYSFLRDNWNYSLDVDSNYGIFKVNNNQAVKIGAKKYKTGPSSGLMIKENNDPVSIIEWQSYISQGSNHKFYFFQKIQPQPTVEMGQGGQQLGTSFDWINADEDCALIRWDPAGRVFDALSLEPIPGASVFLTKNDGKGNFVNASQFELGITNPQLTNFQGGFSFYVSDGDYKLDIKNLESLGYERLASNISEVNSKYSEIFYYLNSGLKKTFIYPAQTGEIIQQKGKMEYRDIPLIPKSGVGKTYPLKIVSAFYSVNRLSGKAVFEGNISHPFTQIVIYGVNNATSIAGLTDENKERVYQGVADNLGNYKIVFSQEKNGKVYDSFNVDFQKTNLTNIAKKNSFLAKIISLFPIGKIVFAQIKDTNKVSLRLDPIPTYLEGIAYDSSGKVLANSQVKIYIKGTNVPYSVVNTNDQGYFKVSSGKIPSFPYEIKYQNPSGKIITVSTSKFIADNRNLISSKKINLYGLKDNQGKSIVLTPKTAQSQSSSASSSNIGKKNLPPSPVKIKTSSSLNSRTVLFLAIIFFLIVLVGVMVYFYFRQKKSSSTLV